MSEHPTPISQRHSKILGRYAHFFSRPEDRLRFINNTFVAHSTNKESVSKLVRRFPALEGTSLHRKLLDLWFYSLIFNELNRLLPASGRERREILRESKASLSARLFYYCFQQRRALCAAGACVLAASPAPLYMLSVAASTRINAYVEQRKKSRDRTPAVAAGPGPSREVGVSYLPAYRPERVWLVEQKDAEERYSNGARIDRSYETTNHARAYGAVPRAGGGAAFSPRHDVAGIVFHTSESDLLPFNESNSESIESHTRGLLEYVKKNRSYNYVIDRFGQIYRVVVDEDAANHAGNSIWADGKDIYVGLNESFLGVCFETRSDSGSSGEELTEAQIISGRLLTQILRSRFNIEDANCVTHGLVSVNPDNMLICYHHDWVHSFPFEAFGLTDKYSVPPVSVSEFGFTYDEGVLNDIGGHIWPGAEDAKKQFEDRAQQANMKVKDLRNTMRTRYAQLMESSRRLRPLNPEKTRPDRGGAQHQQSDSLGGLPSPQHSGANPSL